MHTEEEAKTKWCPEARIIAFNIATGDHAPVAGNGVSKLDGESARTMLCVASACMHWRWALKPNPDFYHSMEGMVVTRGLDFQPVPSHIEDRTQGYCGLSGRPG